MAQSSQGFATCRGLFAHDPQFYFNCKQSGYCFGIASPFSSETTLYSIEKVQDWIKNRKQGWAISSQIEINVYSRKTSFWNWSWDLTIPQSETVDRQAEANRFKLEFEAFFTGYKHQYSQIFHGEPSYLNSEKDRYYPDIKVPVL